MIKYIFIANLLSYYLITSALGNSISPDGRFSANFGLESDGRYVLRISEQSTNQNWILWTSSSNIAHNSEIIDELIWSPSKNDKGDWLIAFRTDILRCPKVYQTNNLYVYDVQSKRFKLKVHFGLRWTQLVRFSPNSHIIATLASTLPDESSYGFDRLILYDINTGSAIDTIYSKSLTGSSDKVAEDFTFISDSLLNISIEGEEREVTHVLRTLNRKTPLSSR